MGFYPSAFGFLDRMHFKFHSFPLGLNILNELMTCRYHVELRFLIHNNDYIRMRMNLLSARLVRVLADGVGLCGQGVEHHSRVDKILLYTLEPGIEFLKPHELSCICNTQGIKYVLAFQRSLRCLCVRERGRVRTHPEPRTGCTRENVALGGPGRTRAAACETEAVSSE